MKTYHQNGIASEDKSIISEDGTFSIRCAAENGMHSFFYPGDNLIREIDLRLSIYRAHLSIYTFLTGNYTTAKPQVFLLA